MTEQLTFDGDTATEYDRGIRRTLPTYDGLVRLANTALRMHAGNDAKVLVVGAGGGNELLEFAEHNPTWKFTAVDPSEPMLKEARAKVEGRFGKERVNFVAGSAVDVPEGTAFGAASCLLVLHFIDSVEEKLALLQEVRRRLKPGAPFVIASMAGDRNDPSFDQLFGLWRQSWIDRSSLSEAQVLEMEKTVRALSFVPGDEIEGLLRDAGFGQVTQFFQTTFFCAWMCVAD
ncbi:class I SAM-dependent methyltransferase [Sporosarcina sp. BI001-red]|uniref:class I SAM-dependent methyltransferase n=1 Tax=Sporosarcina sp. BI001-red TaxID=2282866 RepID=UPI000E239003|nr:class I SAM-dependent methyltransferase [Sporosarcina sp. BI001-red]REB11129.1 class I SAM-dependent methyltransferase [Sporosarcina sp. BI001-red]